MAKSAAQLKKELAARKAAGGGTKKAATGRAHAAQTSGGEWEKSIQTVKDFGELPFSTLLAGPSGSGKTTLASTWPKPLVIDTDHGLRSIVNKDARVIELKAGDRAYSTVLDVIGALRDGASAFSGNNRPKTLIVDSLTALSTLMEIEIITYPPDGKDRQETLFLSDYNLIKQRLMLALIRQMLDLKDIYVVATCGLVFQTDDLGRLIEVPAMTGQKIGPVISHEFDAVARMAHTKEGEHLAVFKPTSRFEYAKMRIAGGVVYDVVLWLVIPTFD